jgi:hypothetical protein
MSLETDFHDEMLAIYRRAMQDFNYPATRYLGMVRRRGGLGAAKKLLEGGPNVESSGLAELVRRGGVDGLAISVENLVVKQRWASLFTDEEREVARDRMARLLRETPV